MENNKMKKGYKPSGVDYTEIVLLAICLLMHFTSWVSMSINGEEIVSFEPFALFGSSFTLVVLVLFLLTAVMKFIGRFSGMTLMVVIHLGVWVFAAHTVFIQGKEMLQYAKGVVNFANGMSNMFGSGNVATNIQSQSVTGFYMLVGILAAVLFVLLLISWLWSACRLASKPRNELVPGYYIGLLGYFVISVMAVVVAYFTFDSIDSIQSIREIQDCVVGVYAILILTIMGTMFTINAIVVILIELLRERNNGKMIWWSLALAGAFFILYLILESTSNDIDYSMFDDMEKFFEYEFEAFVVMSIKIIARSWSLLAMLTCLLRAFYFGVYERRNIPQTDVEAKIAPTNPENRKPTGPKNRKWYYAFFIAAAVIAVIFGIWQCCKGGNDNLLNVEKPHWEKFVIVKTEGISLYKEPTEDSPKLMLAIENIESDVCDFQFRWSDQGKKRGYTVSEYSPYIKAVMPVLEDIGEWYKVHVELFVEHFVEPTEAYVNKKWCQEVKPQPITVNVLEQVDNTSPRCDYIVQKGQFKWLCFTAYFQPIEGQYFEMGQLIDGVLIYPEPKDIFLNPSNSSGISLVKNENYDNYTLSYNDNRSRHLDGYGERIFDTRTLTETEIENIYNTIKLDHPSFVRASYYFPDVDAEELVTFTYRKNSSSMLNSNENDMVQEGVKNYRVSEENALRRLMVDLDEEETFTGVENDWVKLLYEHDFDGDGYNEALILENCGGSSCLEQVCIVYYDKNENTFKQTDYCDSGADPIVEMWNDKMSIVQRYGIRQDRYVYENHSLKQVEKTIQEVGKPAKKWVRSDLFEEKVDDQKEVLADVDGDGIDETLAFGHDTSHASGYGQYMSLYKIRWADGRVAGENEDLGLFTSDSYVLLETKTNGIRDILVGDTYLFRWNGTKYEEWIWDGEQIVKEN